MSNDKPWTSLFGAQIHDDEIAGFMDGLVESIARHPLTQKDPEKVMQTLIILGGQIDNPGYSVSMYRAITERADTEPVEQTPAGNPHDPANALRKALRRLEKGIPHDTTQEQAPHSSIRDQKALLDWIEKQGWPAGYARFMLESVMPFYNPRFPGQPGYKHTITDPGTGNSIEINRAG